MRRNSTLGRKGLPSPSAGRTLASLGCGAGSAARRFDMADPKANAELAREVSAGWKARDFDAVASLMGNDGEMVLVGSDTRFRGPNGAFDFSRMGAGVRLGRGKGVQEPTRPISPSFADQSEALSKFIT